MKVSDVKRLQSFLYVNTQVWPKWLELAETVKSIESWPEIAQYGVAFDFKGVSGYQAIQSSGSWHFSESRHPVTVSIGEAETLHETGRVTLSAGQFIMTDTIYKDLIPFHVFCKEVGRLIMRHSPTAGTTLLIKDIKWEVS